MSHPHPHQPTLDQENGVSSFPKLEQNQFDWDLEAKKIMNKISRIHMEKDISTQNKITSYDKTRTKFASDLFQKESENTPIDLVETYKNLPRYKVWSKLEEKQKYLDYCELVLEIAQLKNKNHILQSRLDLIDLSSGSENDDD